MNTLETGHEPQAEESLADYIRRMRTKRGLSQKSLAEQAGIHLQSVGKLERGKTAKLNHKTQNGLAYALQIPAEYLEAVWRGVSIQSSPSIKFCPPLLDTWHSPRTNLDRLSGKILLFMWDGSPPSV